MAHRPGFGALVALLGCQESTFVDLDPPPVAVIRSHTEGASITPGTWTVFWGLARYEAGTADDVQATWSLDGRVICDPAPPTEGWITRCEAPVAAGSLVLDVTAGGRAARDEATLVDPAAAPTTDDGGGGLDVPDPATDAETDADGLPGDSAAPDVPAPGDCRAPLVWERLDWPHGSVRLDAAGWRGDGQQAWILGGDRVFAYDPVGGAITEVAAAPDGEQWSTITADGDRAWVGGAQGAAPLLRPLDAAGLGAAIPAAGVGSGRLPSGVTIRAIARSPWDGRLALLGDDSRGADARTWGSTYDPAAQVWTSLGSGLTPGGASSVTWGRTAGAATVLATGAETTLLRWTSGAFETVETPGTGNLRRVRADAAGAVAWVMAWSGQGSVYRWDGALDTQGSLHFDGWDLEDWDTDGASALFVGRAGQAWWVPAAFGTPRQAGHTDVSVPGWTSAPWSASTNLALRAVAWRPNHCEGIAVGDPAGGASIVARFTLSR